MNTLAILTPREQHLFYLRTTGMTNKAIAIDLGLSEQTVKNHFTHIYEKLNVGGLTDAMLAMGWGPKRDVTWLKRAMEIERATLEARIAVLDAEMERLDEA